MILHAVDAVQHGSNKILLCTVDTDVLVLAIAFYHEIQVNELWIAFGSGSQFRYIEAHGIAQALGEAKSKALLMFHNCSGSDSTSSHSTSWQREKRAWGEHG